MMINWGISGLNRILGLVDWNKKACMKWGDGGERKLIGCCNSNIDTQNIKFA
jgi:hypothetical protein